MKIAFLDLEGTLTKGECWSDVKDKFGGEEFVEEYIELFEQGRIGYEEWRRKLVEAWSKNKTTKKQFIDALRKYELMPGTKKLIDGLKKKGFTIVIITGGPDIFAELVSEELGFDEIYAANEFVFSGELFVDIKTHDFYRRGQGKIDFIKKVISNHGADIKDCIAVGGDDINDYWMMKELESFAVKPHLRQIKEVVNHEVDNLAEVLDYL